MAISLDQFQQLIAASELLKQDELLTIMAAFPEDRRPTTAEELARELVRQKRLTKYQAEQIYAGKGKSLVLGNYLVLDKLGQGGMGVVLKAEHKRLKRPVALKVMSQSIAKTPDALKRFHREVEAAAKLRHPNVVATDDADEFKGTHFLVMEYVEGSDLSAYVKKNGPLPVGQAVRCIIQAARGLEFAHSLGVIHRDIKPANLLLDKSGIVKILDLGLARIEGSTTTQSELTSTGAVMGTVDYMAPEQAVSTKGADARSDIYSLGISLWYLLTGRCAFEGNSMVAKLLAHRDAPIPSLMKANEDVPEWVDGVFRKMVAKSRNDRYQTMSEVIRDLENGQSGSSSNMSMPQIPEDLNLQSFLSQLGGTAAATAATQKIKPEPNAIRVDPAVEVTAVMGNVGVDTEPQTLNTIQQDSLRKSQTLSPTAKQLPTAKPATPPTWFRNPRILMTSGIAAIMLPAAATFFLRTPEGTRHVGTPDSETQSQVRIERTDDMSPVKSQTAGEVIDLLAKIELPRDSVKHPTHGDWTRDGSVLISPEANKPGRIQIPYEPPPEYEITAVVERMSGVDGVMFGVIVDGYAAEVGVDLFVPQVSGLSLIDRKELPNTATAFRQPLLPDRRQYSIRITVGRRSVRASIDNREFLNWEGDPSVLSPQTQLPDLTHLWFGAAFDQFKFHKLEVRPLTSSDRPAEPRIVGWPFDPNDGHEYEWSEPENLGPSINRQHFDEHPELTPNGLEMWFSGGGELWVAERDSINAPWREKRYAGSQINDHSSWDSEPTLSADGLTLVFCSDRESDSKDQNLWMCTRTHVSEPFGRPVKLGWDISTAAWENSPALSADGLTLIYTSAGTGATPDDVDLWEATRLNSNSGFGNGRRLGPTINSPFRDAAAHLSSDGLVLLLESSRGGAAGDLDLYFSTRATEDAEFGTPVSIGMDINTEHNEQAPCLSHDGRTLMFYSNRPGGQGEADIWQSRRIRKSAIGDAQTVYLDSLTATAYVGFDQLRRVGEDAAAVGSLKNNFTGISASRGLIVHPNGEPTGTCRITYELDGQFATLKGSALCRPVRSTPILAEILADGKSVWKSGDLAKSKPNGNSFDISVRGVRQLTLIATSEKEMFAAHVLWKELRLSNDSPQ